MLQYRISRQSLEIRPRGVLSVSLPDVETSIVIYWRHMGRREELLLLAESAIRYFRMADSSKSSMPITQVCKTSCSTWCPVQLSYRNRSHHSTVDLVSIPEPLACTFPSTCPDSLHRLTTLRKTFETPWLLLPQRKIGRCEGGSLRCGGESSLWRSSQSLCNSMCP